MNRPVKPKKSRAIEASFNDHDAHVLRWQKLNQVTGTGWTNRESPEHDTDVRSFIEGFSKVADARKKSHWDKAKELRVKIKQLTLELKREERLGLIHEAPDSVNNHIGRRDLSRQQDNKVLDWLAENGIDAKRLVYENGKRTTRADCIDALQGKVPFKLPNSVSQTWRRLSGDGTTCSIRVIKKK